MKVKGTKNINITMRLQLEALLRTNLTRKEIAQSLGISVRTLYYELNRGWYMHEFVKNYCSYTKGFVRKYSPQLAEEYAQKAGAKRSNGFKIAGKKNIIKYIKSRVKERMPLSVIYHEINQNANFGVTFAKSTLYRYAHRGILKKSIIYPRKLEKEKSLAKIAPPGKSIEQRPLLVLSRLEFGHWELDGVIGLKTESALLLNFTERKTRYSIVLRISSKKAHNVVASIDFLQKIFGKYFTKVFKSITVDNGKEFAYCKRMEYSADGKKRLDVYYCHPSSPNERGSNERFNSDIRRWCPSGKDIGKYSNKYICHISEWLNKYPRKVLGWRTPGELFAEELKKIA